MTRKGPASPRVSVRNQKIRQYMACQNGHLGLGNLRHPRGRSWDQQRGLPWDPARDSDPTQEKPGFHPSALPWVSSPWALASTNQEGSFWRFGMKHPTPTRKWVVFGPSTTDQKWIPLCAERPPVRNWRTPCGRPCFAREAGLGDMGKQANRSQQRGPPLRDRARKAPGTLPDHGVSVADPDPLQRYSPHRFSVSIAPDHEPPQ